MIYVKKLNGKKEKYNESKLKRSLSNSGADKETIDKLIIKVNKIIYDGIETKELFKFVFKEFKKYYPYTASKYNLKNAILRLGIEGFYFEKLISRILQKQGYSTKLNQVIKGKYIPHEIDIIASKNNKKIMVECKHHIKPWLGCKIQTALYINSRFLDVKKVFNLPMLVTNTKFSDQVIKYSKGVGIRLMGWKFPKDDSLEYNLEKFGLYPVTMLSSLNKEDIYNLLNSNILFINELNEDKLNIFKKQKLVKILKESEEILKGK